MPFLGLLRRFFTPVTTTVDLDCYEPAESRVARKLQGATAAARCIQRPLLTRRLVARLNWYWNNNGSTIQPAILSF